MILFVDLFHEICALDGGGGGGGGGGVGVGVDVGTGYLRADDGRYEVLRLAAAAAAASAVLIAVCDLGRARAASRAVMWAWHPRRDRRPAPLNRHTADVLKMGKERRLRGFLTRALSPCKRNPDAAKAENIQRPMAQGGVADPDDEESDDGLDYGRLVHAAHRRGAACARRARDLASEASRARRAHTASDAATAAH